MKRWFLGVSLLLIAVSGAVNRAEGWTMATHQKAASGAASALPPGALRDLLLDNEGYLRGGAVGPDIFYLAPGSKLYSDLAHYWTSWQRRCSLRPGRSDTANAFAYGWFSHTDVQPHAGGYRGAGAALRSRGLLVLSSTAKTCSAILIALGTRFASLLFCRKVRSSSLRGLEGFLSDGFHNCCKNQARGAASNFRKKGVESFQQRPV